MWPEHGKDKIEVHFGRSWVVRSWGVVGRHLWCGGGAVDSGWVVWSQRVVGRVAVVYLVHW